MQLLAQDGYHFTDLSPSGNVVATQPAARLHQLDTATALVPNLPWPPAPGVRRSARTPRDRAHLSGRELELYRDHAGAGAARHLVLIRGDEWCYVIFRKDRRKGLPLFASSST